MNNMNKLRARRLRKKFWTQKELAEASGVSQVTISFIENGVSLPMDITLAKLANALDCEIEDLREGEDEQ